MNERTLPARPVAALYGYFEAATRPDARPEYPTLDAATAQATRLLTPTERATARIVVGPPRAQHDTFSVLHEAALRLSILDACGALSRLSAHAVAQTLQEVLFNAHPRALTYAVRGWLTLELLDRHDLAQVWIGTPDPADPRRLARVRLRERMTSIRAELKCAHSQNERSERGRVAPR